MWAGTFVRKFLGSSQYKFFELSKTRTEITNISVAQQCKFFVLRKVIFFINFTLKTLKRFDHTAVTKN